LLNNYAIKEDAIQYVDTSPLLLQLYGNYLGAYRRRTTILWELVRRVQPNLLTQRKKETGQTNFHFSAAAAAAAARHRQERPSAESNKMIFSPPAQWHFGVCVTGREEKSGASDDANPKRR
jgi:hypothetical protein